MSAEKYHNVNKKILYKNRNLQKVKNFSKLWFNNLQKSS